MSFFAMHGPSTALHAGAEQLTGPEYLAGVLVFLLTIAVIGALAHVLVGQVTTGLPEPSTARSVEDDEP